MSLESPQTHHANEDTNHGNSVGGAACGESLYCVLNFSVNLKWI